MKLLRIGWFWNRYLLTLFKLAPEIKYFYGFNDLLQINNVELTSNIESFFSRTILFSLTFE